MDISVAYWIGFLISFIAFICCIICSYLDLEIDFSLSGEKEFKIIKDNKTKKNTNLLTSIKNFKIEYWIVTLIYMLGLSSIYPYINFSSAFLFKTKFSKIPDKHLAETESDMYTGFCFIICAIIDPIIGLIQKKFGFRPYLLLTSVIFGLIAISLFYFNPLIGIVSLGLSSSILLTVTWTTIQLIVPKEDEVIKLILFFIIL